EGDSVAKLTISAAARTWCVACSALLPRSSYATTETATHGATGPVRPHPHSQPRIYRVSHPPAKKSSSGARMGLYPTLAAHRGLSRPAAHGHGSLARGEPSWGDAAHDDRRHGPAGYAPLLSGARLSRAGAIPSLERGMSDDSHHHTAPSADTAG